MIDFEKLKNGDILQIKNSSYEVLYTAKEADVAKPPKYEIRIYTVVYLHNIKSKSLHPTNILWYYPNTKMIYILEMEQKKPPKWLINPRTRGDILSFKNKVRLNSKNIKRISK